MEDLNNALNNIESKLEERGIKVKKIRQSKNFYNSNSGLYERKLKITNDNSYQLTPSNRTFNNYNSGRSINDLIIIWKYWFNLEKYYQLEKKIYTLEINFDQLSSSIKEIISK